MAGDEQRQAVAGCRAVRGSRVGGERGHLAVRGGAGRTRAARRALRAETVGGGSGGVDRRFRGPRLRRPVARSCEGVYVVGDGDTLPIISSLTASLPWPRKTSR